MSGQGITLLRTTSQVTVVDFKNREKSFLQLFSSEKHARLSLENAELLLRKVVTLRRIQDHLMSSEGGLFILVHELRGQVCLKYLFYIESRNVELYRNVESYRS